MLMLSVIILTNPQNGHYRVSRAIEIVKIVKIEPKKGLKTLFHQLKHLETHPRVTGRVEMSPRTLYHVVAVN